MIQENQKINEIKEKLNLAFEKIGTLTIVQRLAICLITFIAIGGAYYYFVAMPKHTQLKQLKDTYHAQEQKLATFKKRAAEILKYEKLMAQKQEEFTIAMRALPDNRELPSLLTGISKAGSDAGLIIHLFQPDTENNKEFYKEIPVSIKAEGKYHQLTDFFHQITRLNRIVNINNVEVGSDKGGVSLIMSCKAVTYMFIEKKEPVNKNKQRNRNQR